MESNRSAALARFLTGIICDVRIRRSAGEHRTRLTSANRRLRRYWPPDAMPRRCCEFVDSRLRRSPPDRASAVPYGQAGENAMRFPRLAHRSAAAHKLHSTPQQDRMNLISGKGETSSRLPAFSLFLPGPVQTPGTVAVYSRETGMDRHAANHYPVMKDEQIKAVSPPAAEDCVLFLWSTRPKLQIAI